MQIVGEQTQQIRHSLFLMILRVVISRDIALKHLKIYKYVKYKKDSLSICLKFVCPSVCIHECVMAKFDLVLIL